MLSVSQFPNRVIKTHPVGWWLSPKILTGVFGCACLLGLACSNDGAQNLPPLIQDEEDNNQDSGGDTGGDDDNPTLTLSGVSTYAKAPLVSKMSIGGAASLIVRSDFAEDEATFLSVDADAQEQEVTYEDMDGQQIVDLTIPIRIFPVGQYWIATAYIEPIYTGDPENFEPNTSWYDVVVSALLTNQEDGATYLLDSFTIKEGYWAGDPDGPASDAHTNLSTLNFPFPDPLGKQNFLYPEIQTDGGKNIYYREDGRIVKIDVSDADQVQRTILTPDAITIEKFAVADSGLIWTPSYLLYPDGTLVPNQDILKAEQSLDTYEWHSPEHGPVWKAPNGKLHTQFVLLSHPGDETYQDDDECTTHTYTLDFEDGEVVFQDSGEQWEQLCMYRWYFADSCALDDYSETSKCYYRQFGVERQIVWARGGSFGFEMYAEKNVGPYSLSRVGGEWEFDRYDSDIYYAPNGIFVLQTRDTDAGGLGLALDKAWAWNAFEEEGEHTFFSEDVTERYILTNLFLQEEDGPFDEDINAAVVLNGNRLLISVFDVQDASDKVLELSFDGTITETNQSTFMPETETLIRLR